MIALNKFIIYWEVFVYIFYVTMWLGLYKNPMIRVVRRKLEKWRVGISSWWNTCFGKMSFVKHSAMHREYTQWNLKKKGRQCSSVDRGIAYAYTRPGLSPQALMNRAWTHTSVLSTREWRQKDQKSRSSSLHSQFKAAWTRNYLNEWILPVRKV